MRWIWSSLALAPLSAVVFLWFTDWIDRRLELDKGERPTTAGPRKPSA